MGYTHYYIVNPKFDAKLFKKVGVDFKKMLEPLSRLGIKLGDGRGENSAIILPTEICFNGSVNCKGLQNSNWKIRDSKKGSQDDIDKILSFMKKESWFKDENIMDRSCDGDYSHETFSLEQKLETVMTRHDGSKYSLDPDEEGKYFQFTKTARKPYDLAVNVVLIIAKHYLKKEIFISSDGDESNWVEGKQLCNHFLGYGADFKLGEDGD